MSQATSEGAWIEEDHAWSAASCPCGFMAAVKSSMFACRRNQLLFLHEQHNPDCHELPAMLEKLLKADQFEVLFHDLGGES